jgi:hypothetical protein
MGRIVTGSSVITGIVLLAIPDRASIKVIPTAAASPPQRKPLNSVADKDAIGALPGLSIVGTF